MDSLKEIREGFASLTAQGPSAVIRFTGLEDMRVNAYQRVKPFLEELPFSGCVLRDCLKVLLEFFDKVERWVSRLYSKPMVILYLILRIWCLES